MEMTRFRPPTVIAMLTGIVTRGIGSAAEPVATSRDTDVPGLPTNESSSTRTLASSWRLLHRRLSVLGLT